MPTAAPQQDIMGELSNAAKAVTSFYHQLPMIFTRLALAGVVIVIGLLLLQMLKKLVNKRFRPSQQRTIKQAETLRSLIISVIRYLSYFFIALVVLRIFNIDLASLLAVAGIGSIAIGFGAQSLVKDIISGMFIWMEGNINVGDIVTVAGQSGKVEALSLRTTVLRGTDGRLLAIPNGDIRTVICRSNGKQRAQVNVTIAHGQDLLKAQSLLTDECERLAESLALPQAPVVYPAIASDARCVTMLVEYPCEPDDVWPMEREIRLRMFQRLQQEGFRT